MSKNEPTNDEQAKKSKSKQKVEQTELQQQPLGGNVSGILSRQPSNFMRPQTSSVLSRQPSALLQRSVSESDAEVDRGYPQIRTGGRNFAQFVGQTGDPTRIQPKLMTGPTGDKYELEADRIAKQVVDTPAPVQRQSGFIQRKVEKSSAPWGPTKGKWISTLRPGVGYETEEEARVADQEAQAAEDKITLSQNGTRIAKMPKNAINGDRDTNEQKAVTAALAVIGTHTHEVCEDRGTHNNTEGNLPGEPGVVEYREWGIKPPSTHGNHWPGPRRLIQNTESKHIYYTWTHYGEQGTPAFVLLQ